MTNAEKHALALKIYGRLTSASRPAEQMDFLEQLVSVLNEEQLEALQFAFERPPVYHQPTNPRVFTPRLDRDVKRRV